MNNHTDHLTPTQTVRLLAHEPYKQWAEKRGVNEGDWMYWRNANETFVVHASCVDIDRLTERCRLGSMYILPRLDDLLECLEEITGTRPCMLPMLVPKSDWQVQVWDERLDTKPTLRKGEAPTRLEAALACAVRVLEGRTPPSEREKGKG